MNRQPEQHEQPLEPDPVWDLVDKAPTRPASASFVRKTVQMVREQRRRQTWWQRLLAPVLARPTASMAGLAAAAAAVVLVVNLVQPGEQPAGVASFDSPQGNEIEEAIATEMLMAAAENPSEFSDQELVCLLGF